MPKFRSKKSKKRSFYGNQFTKVSKNIDDNDVKSASFLKLQNNDFAEDMALEQVHKCQGNRIFDISTLVSLFSVLCCPQCFDSGLILIEDSKFGLCSNFSLKCKCGFITGFSSTPKNDKKNILNYCLVLGLRLIGKGYSSGKKLLLTMNLPMVSKSTFRQHENKLLEAVLPTANENMVKAAQEVKVLKNSSECGVSVDGSWQRRGYNSLNGVVSAISINTGKILDIEVLSQYCRFCQKGSKKDHICSNHKGSSAKMETVGAYRIFERSFQNRDLKYLEYYGDGDSKGYMSVKDIYGKDSVIKLECIGHVQKRVGSRLRKLKKNKKGLTGRGKLTDTLIDKFQNYYGIAIRSNVGNLQNMQSAVIAAFFHCCSGSKNQMHGQCPIGPDSWCKFRRAESIGQAPKEKCQGLSNSVINLIKPTYMSLCDKTLLSKCLHGKTQNNNESYNNVIWSLLPKDTFVGIETMLLGANLSVILFNSGFYGLIPLFEWLGLPVSKEMRSSFLAIDSDRINASNRHSLPSTKLKRKKRKSFKKAKVEKCEHEEGITYKSGAF